MRATRSCTRLVATIRGLAAGYEFMNGYGSHTFMCYSEKLWVKVTFDTEQGIKNLTGAKASHDPR